MAHALIASPFLDGHLLLKPGARAGARISADHYESLRQAATDSGSLPAWAVQTAADTWGLDLGGNTAHGTVLVREPSPYGYCRASWEINLGCNFGCKHCYLGERPFSGLAWPDKVRLLDIMREAGVLWLQITGGEPTMDPHFQGAYRHAWLAGMMLTISTNGSLLWRPDLLKLSETARPTGWSSACTGRVRNPSTRSPSAVGRGRRSGAGSMAPVRWGCRCASTSW